MKNPLIKWGIVSNIKEDEHMKVKELIKELKEYNPEATVSLVCSETIAISFIADKELGDTPQTTRHIFIEGVDELEFY